MIFKLLYLEDVWQGNDLDIVDTHDASTVIHILLEVFFLKKKCRDVHYILEWFTHTLRFLRYVPGTQTQESGTCQCGWCHGEWRCLHVSSLSVETLKETDASDTISLIKTTFRLQHSSKIIQQTNRLIITYGFFTYCMYSGEFYHQIIRSEHVNRSLVPSRMAVQGAPSSCSRRISFRATKLSVNLLRPLNTVA